MTQLLYHIKALCTSKFLDGICLLDKLVKQATFDEAFVAYPQDKFALFVVGQLPQFVDPDAGVSSRLFQAQIALEPEWDLLHGLLTGCQWNRSRHGILRPGHPPH